MVVDSVNMLDGNVYLVSQGDNIKPAGATDFDNVINNISSGSESLDDIFNEVSNEYGVNVNLLKAVAKAESDFDTEAVSYCGAQGIMQLMPTTAESLGVEDPFDARQNITVGAKMLAYLLDDYNGNVTLALAAYNAGSGSVSKYGGVPPYKETLGYIDRINDILGGALSSDSTTIDGAGATDLSQSICVGDTGIMVDSQNNSQQGENNQELSALRNQITANKYNISDAVLKSRASSGTSSSNVLFSYDDYKYVINTYKAILSKLLAVSSTINTSDDSNTYNTAYNNYSDDNSALGYYKNGLLSTSQSVLKMLNMN
uniref:lytic transglycosylase domain-containing protein n=1 Tax=[Lactobacillus] rogosae TaxID=706562 RepID=UPI003FEED439